MNKFKTITALILTALTVSGCSIKQGTDVKSKYAIQAKELASANASISSANNKVAFKFLKETANSDKKENIVVSPLSLNTILALTQNGAEGSTKEEMLRALELTGLKDSEINEGYRDIIAHFNSVTKVETKVGNSIWAAEGMKVRQEFVDIGRSFYEAEVKEVDFTKKKTVNVINDWVSKQTAGKIEKIIDSFEQDTAMALINTVYFKGKWRSTFDEQATEKQKFTLSGGSTKDVDVMRKTLGAEYLKGNNFTAVRLPYEDIDYGMYVFLPDKGTDVDALIKDMNNDNWNKWMQEFANKQVSVKLSKFKIEYEKKLNDMLKSFGMKDAFDEKTANFSGISEDQQLFIDLVKQKAFIEVNEGGTEAAAATAVVIRTTSAPADKPIEFTVDRPFVYAIADKKTGFIMFIGKVENP